MRYMFVGERRSQTAIQRGWRWESGHLAARTLFAALEACHVDPQSCRFVNAYTDAGDVSGQLWSVVKPASEAGIVIVAMGKVAQTALRLAQIPYRPLIHPAARGKIRKREWYHAHVREVLHGHP